METKEGVENIEEICAVPGLDSIVFGQMVRARMAMAYGHGRFAPMSPSPAMHDLAKRYSSATGSRSPQGKFPSVSFLRADGVHARPRRCVLAGGESVIKC